MLFKKKTFSRHFWSTEDWLLVCNVTEIKISCFNKLYMTNKIYTYTAIKFHTCNTKKENPISDITSLSFGWAAWVNNLIRSSKIIWGCRWNEYEIFEPCLGIMFVLWLQKHITVLFICIKMLDKSVFFVLSIKFCV